MPSIKRSASASTLVLCFLFFSTQAQTPQVSTVNVTAEESNVRISAAGDVLDMRVAVSDESGDVVFESGPVADGKLDWVMRDAQGQRVPTGSYTLTVTYRTSSGKLRRRVEQVFVTEEVSVGTSAAAEDPTPQAVGTITGQGTTGKIAKFTGANSVGDSVMFESSGKIGIGTTAPQQSLHAVGPSSRLRLQSTNGPALTTTEYVTNGRVWQSGAGGSTALNGVANKFFVYDQTANQYRLVIDTAGNFGIGTTAPTSKLTVNGGIQILGAGNGIKFPDGSIQTKAIAGTINGTGTANRIAKFTGPNSFGNSSITEVSGRVGIGTAAPLSRLDVRGDLFVGLTAVPDSGPNSYSLFIVNDVGDARNSFRLDGYENNLYLIARSGASSAAGAGIVFRTAPAAGGENDRMIITPDGNVGIGTTDPDAKLHAVVNSSITYAVRGRNDGAGAGVAGYSETGDGVAGFSRSPSGSSSAAISGVNPNGGYAGYFSGKVAIVGSCSGCTTAPSDRALKTNISAINPRSILDRLASLPIRTWNYKSDESSVRHVGPMAQDFRAAFQLGKDDRHIDLIDANGVTMAAIQGLYQQNQELAAEVRQLRAQMAQQRAQLSQVRRTIKRRRAAKR